MTSAAKNTPPIGALNVAEIPAAAPHATSVRTIGAGARTTCPSTEPMVEPIWTIGPSRPQLPPKPIEVAEANALIPITRGRIFPPRSATASITSGTPCPLASGAKVDAIQAAMMPPSASCTTIANTPMTLPRDAPMTLNAKNVSPLMSARKATAPKPPPRPTMPAVTIKKVVWDIVTRPTRSWDRPSLRTYSITR